MQSELYYLLQKPFKTADDAIAISYLSSAIVEASGSFMKEGKK
jgi:hypothetical protein